MAFEWLRFIFALEPHPYVASILGLVILLLVIRQIKSLKKKWRSLRQGRDGERYIAQVLDSLIAQGAQVIHDIPADGFNLDHVVIGPFGIWMVETKTISKPASGRSEIIYSESGLVINGGPVTVASLEQATAQAQWLRKRIKELTGLDVPVRPVVIYAGWYIRCEKPWTKPVWVMHEQSFVTMVLRESCQVSEVDRKAIGFHLRRMANSQVSI